MSTFIRKFNLHEQITKFTELDVQAYPDKDSKVGKSYKRFTVEFSKKAKALAEDVEGLPPIEDVQFTQTNTASTREREPLPRAKGAERINGSAECGEHAKKCIKILMDYKAWLTTQGRKLPSRDVKLLTKYLAVIGTKDEATGLNAYLD